jgi:arabinosaccharide transport system substrate-binding protein
MKALSDGLVLFFWTPDWRSFWFQMHAPKNAGKMALMPLPAFEAGGRRTSVWGGAGVAISKNTRRPEDAWKLVKFLYLDPAELEPRFEGTNILPPLKEAWKLPAFQAPNPYYSGQRVGKLYAELAPETPPVYSSPVHAFAGGKLDEALFRSAEHYKIHGEKGLVQKVRVELKRAQREVEQLAHRARVLELAK